ncbi:MAG: hypothetical protein Tsb0021_06130 [Chlamydiales bacterium]
MNCNNISRIRTYTFNVPRFIFFSKLIQKICSLVTEIFSRLKASFKNLFHTRREANVHSYEVLNSDQTNSETNANLNEVLSPEQTSRVQDTITPDFTNIPQDVKKLILSYCSLWDLYRASQVDRDFRNLSNDQMVKQLSKLYGLEEEKIQLNQEKQKILQLVSILYKDDNVDSEFPLDKVVLYDESINTSSIEHHKVNFNATFIGLNQIDQNQFIKIGKLLEVKWKEISENERLSPANKVNLIANSIVITPSVPLAYKTYTELMKMAIYFGNNTFAKKLFKGCGSKNILIVRENQESILYFASKCDNAEIIEEIAATRPLNLNSPNAELLTPLMVAAKLKCIRAIHSLLSFNVSTGSVYVGPPSPLFDIAAYGDFNLVQKMLLAGAEPNPIDKETGLSALQNAVLHENIDAIQCLIDGGAYLNYKKSQYGDTALTLAVKHAKLKSIQQLLLNKEKFGKKPIDCLSTSLKVAIDTKQIPYDKKLTMIRLFLEHGANTDNTLHLAVEFSDIPEFFESSKEIISVLLEYNANINEKNRDGETPLHVLIKNARNLGYTAFKESAFLLISMGADLTVKNNAGSTPLDYAVILNHLEIVKEMHNHGADLSTLITDWQEILGLSPYRTDLLTKYLFENGASP